MRAFEVYLNGKRLCTAGIGDDGVLTTIVNYVVGNGRDEVNLHVGGLISPIDEDVTWRTTQIQTGDEVRVRVIEAAKVDKPRKRHRRDFAAEKRQTKRYVRAMAKQFGWQITTRKSKSD
jgi:hypothetical protein